MAENDTENDQQRLEVTDDDAAQLLADDDGDDGQNDRPDQAAPSATDERDWKAEAEKWKILSRKNEKAARERAAKLEEYENANKTEAQRLQDERDSHKTRAERAEAALKRREIAEQFAPEHATLAQIKAVAKRLSGDSDDALEEDAKEMFELLAPEPARPKTPTRPRERLRGGGEPESDDPDDTDDPRKLADRITGVRRS